MFDPRAYYFFVGPNRILPRIPRDRSASVTKNGHLFLPVKCMLSVSKTRSEKSCFDDAKVALIWSGAAVEFNGLDLFSQRLDFVPRARLCVFSLRYYPVKILALATKSPFGTSIFTCAIKDTAQIGFIFVQRPQRRQRLRQFRRTWSVTLVVNRLNLGVKPTGISLRFRVFAGVRFKYRPGPTSHRAAITPPTSFSCRSQVPTGQSCASSTVDFQITVNLAGTFYVSAGFAHLRLCSQPPTPGSQLPRQAPPFPVASHPGLTH